MKKLYGCMAFVMLLFCGAIQASAQDTFTLIVDDLTTNFNKFVDTSATSTSIALSVGTNEIPVGSGSFRFIINSTSGDLPVVIADGAEVSRKAKNYNFTVKAGSVVTVTYHQAPADPKMTFVTDDPTKIASFVNTTQDASVNVAVIGVSEVEYKTGDSFAITLAEGATPIMASVQGVEITPVDGVYTFAPADGDVVRLFFKYAPKGTDLRSVKCSFANEGTEDVINYIWFDDDPIRSDYEILLSGVLVDKGTQVGFNYKNHDYRVNSITVNGVARTTNTGAFYFNVNSDTEVVFDVEKYAEYNFVINCETPANVIAYYGTDESRSVSLEVPVDEDHPHTFAFSTKETNNEITITRNPEIVPPVMIAEVTVDGAPVAANENGNYVVTVADGTVIDIVTEEVTFNETLIVYSDIDIKDYEDYNGMAESGTLNGRRSGRSIALVHGRNEVKFNSAYDGDMLYGYTPMPQNVHTYLNGTEIEPAQELLGLFYLIPAADGDIIRTYYTYAEPVFDEVENVYRYPDTTPAQHAVTFDIDTENLSTEGETPDIIIKREDLHHIAIGDVTELPGTLYYIYVHNSVKDVKIKVNDEEIANTLAKAVTNTPDGYTHKATVPVLGDMKLSIVSAESTGVEGISIDADLPGSIYGIDGRIVKTGATAADLRDLPAGLYILNGRKVMVK